MKKPLTKRKNMDPRLRPIAQAIQGAMGARGMDVPMLTEAMGLTKSQRGAVGNWVAGVNGPGAQLRPRLAEVLGLDPNQLTLGPLDSLGRRRPQGAQLGRPAHNLGPAQRAVALVEVARANGEILPAPPPVTDVFTIRARSDGTMVIRLDANLPFAKGAQLVSYLISFGLVVGSGSEQAGT